MWTPYALVVGGLGLWHVSSAIVATAAVVYGILLYSLIEYLMHRFLYHWEPQNRWVRRLTADVGRHHMNHHREPAKYGGAINGNQVPVVMLASAIAAFFLSLDVVPGFALIATLAGAMNYVAQELVHFGTHQLPMDNRLLAIVKRHHMLHHYRDENSNFGLFWTFWDRIFCTRYDGRRLG